MNAICLWCAVMALPLQALAKVKSSDTGMVILPKGPAVSDSTEANATSALENQFGRRRRGDIKGIHDRWCAEGQNSGKQIALEQTAASDDAEFGGYCYYLSKAGQNCNDACIEQVGGKCDAYGTEFAASDVERCQKVVQAFGIPTVGLGTKSVNDRAGCTFSDPQADGTGSKADLMAKDDSYPLCSEEHKVAFSHRVCACTPSFGDFGAPFKEELGECKVASDSSQNRIKTGYFAKPGECEDECTRDANCGAFAYVHPWDGPSSRVCHFYSADHVGDGGNHHVHCFVKDAYLATVGRCKKHGVETHDQSSETNVQTSAECKDKCDEETLCKAYELHMTFEADSSCILFKDGHTGDGHSAKRCFTKEFGGVAAR